MESEDEEFESEEAASDLDEQGSPSATIKFISDEQITAAVFKGP